MYLQQHKMKAFQMNPEFVGAKFFNLIPTKIKAIATFDKFKLALGQYLAVRPYYSINDFSEKNTRLITSADKPRQKISLTLTIISWSREK